MKKMLKGVAAVTLFCFLTTQCVSAAPGAGIEMAGQRELPSYLSIDVPPELGTVDALYDAPSGAHPQFILHIQNAHANYQAQIKIKQLLGHMNKKYGFKTIFVEGASEKLDADYLRLFPDQERNLKLCDELAKQGELTGAELFLMEQNFGSPVSEARSSMENRGARTKDRGPDVEALGIEQASLYKANYDALKKVFGAEADVTHFFKGFDGKLDKVASATFTPETRELIANWKRFEQGRREFMPFVKTLAAQSKKIMKVDLESLFAQVGWPQITRLLVIQQMEKELNKAKGQEEQQALIKMLRTKGVSKELLATLENFTEGSIAVGKSAIEVSPREILERLAQEAGPQGFKFSDWPAFSLYAGYVTLRSELDPKVLFEEIEYLFTQMLDTLAQEPQQKALLTLYRDGELLRKLLHLELNRTQWRELLERKDDVAIPSLVARLREAVSQSLSSPNALIGDPGRKNTGFPLKTRGNDNKTGEAEVMPKAFSDKMNSLFTAGLEFYGFAHQREAVFYKEMQSQMAERKITKAILITGGFHTDGMSDLFRDNAISYGIVTPRLSEKSNENLYHSIMLQDEQVPFNLSYLEAAPHLADLFTIENQGLVPVETLKSILKPFIDVGNFGTLNEAAVAAFNAITTGPKYQGQKVTLELIGNNQARVVLATSQVIKAEAGKVLKFETGPITSAMRLPQATSPVIAPPNILSTSPKASAASVVRSEARSTALRTGANFEKDVETMRDGELFLELRVYLAHAVAIEGRIQMNDLLDSRKKERLLRILGNAVIKGNNAQWAYTLGHRKYGEELRNAKEALISLWDANQESIRSDRLATAGESRPVVRAEVRGMDQAALEKALAGVTGLPSNVELTAKAGVLSIHFKDLKGALDVKYLLSFSVELNGVRISDADRDGNPMLPAFIPFTGIDPATKKLVDFKALEGKPLPASFRSEARLQEPLTAREKGGFVRDMWVAVAGVVGLLYIYDFGAVAFGRAVTFGMLMGQGWFVLGIAVVAAVVSLGIILGLFERTTPSVAARRANRVRGPVEIGFRRVLDRIFAGRPAQPAVTSVASFVPYEPEKVVLQMAGLKATIQRNLATLRDPEDIIPALERGRLIDATDRRLDQLFELNRLEIAPGDEEAGLHAQTAEEIVEYQRQLDVLRSDRLATAGESRPVVRAEVREPLFKGTAIAGAATATAAVIYIALSGILVPLNGMIVLIAGAALLAWPAISIFYESILYQLSGEAKREREQPSDLEGRGEVAKLSVSGLTAILPAIFFSNIFVAAVPAAAALLPFAVTFVLALFASATVIFGILSLFWAPLYRSLEKRLIKMTDSLLTRHSTEAVIGRLDLILGLAKANQWNSLEGDLARLQTAVEERQNSAVAGLLQEAEQDAAAIRERIPADDALQGGPIMTIQRQLEMVRGILGLPQRSETRRQAGLAGVVLTNREMVHVSAIFAEVPPNASERKGVSSLQNFYLIWNGKGELASRLETLSLPENAKAQMVELLAGVRARVAQATPRSEVRLQQQVPVGQVSVTWREVRGRIAGTWSAVAGAFIAVAPAVGMMAVSAFLNIVPSFMFLVGVVILGLGVMALSPLEYFIRERMGFYGFKAPGINRIEDLNMLNAARPGVEAELAKIGKSIGALEVLNQRFPDSARIQPEKVRLETKREEFATWIANVEAMTALVTLAELQARRPNRFLGPNDFSSVTGRPFLNLLEKVSQFVQSGKKFNVLLQDGKNPGDRLVITGIEAVARSEARLQKITPREAIIEVRKLLGTITIGDKGAQFHVSVPDSWDLNPNGLVRQIDGIISRLRYDLTDPKIPSGENAEGVVVVTQLETLQARLLVPASPAGESRPVIRAEMRADVPLSREAAMDNKEIAFAVMEQIQEIGVRIKSLEEQLRLAEVKEAQSLRISILLLQVEESFLTGNKLPESTMSSLQALKTESAQSIFSDLEGEILAAEDKIAELKNEKGTAEEKLRDLGAKKDADPEKIKSAERRVSNIQRQIDNLSQSVAQLGALLDQYREMLSSEAIQRAEVRSIVEARQAGVSVSKKQTAVATWLEKNFTKQQVRTLVETSRAALKAMKIPESELKTPALKVAVAVTVGIGRDNMEALAPLLIAVAMLVDERTITGLTQALQKAVPNVSLLINGDAGREVKVLKGMADPKVFLNLLKLSLLLNPNMQYDTVVLGSKKDVGVAVLAVREGIAQWADAIHRPAFKAQVKIQDFEVSAQDKVSAFIRASGNNVYVVTGTADALSYLKPDAIMGLAIHEADNVQGAIPQTAVRRVTTRAAQNVFGMRGSTPAEMASLLKQQPDSGFERGREGLEITQSSIQGLVANMQALFEAFQKIQSAA